jgi:hypothetical protein
MTTSHLVGQFVNRRGVQTPIGTVSCWNYMLHGGHAMVPIHIKKPSPNWAGRISYPVCRAN